MTDPRTGITRGYGFIRFNSQLDQHQAMTQMQGFVIGNRPIRVSLATPKTTTTTTTTTSHNDPTSPVMTPQQNTTVFVGGLSCPLQEQELKQYFSIFGEIIYVKIPPGKGCGFVQFVSRQSAEMAIDQMNGYQIGSCRIRLSWGKSQNQPHTLKKDMTSKVHPFDQDEGFMTLFDTFPSTNSTLYSSDYHIFAQ